MARFRLWFCAIVVFGQYKLEAAIASQLKCHVAYKVQSDPAKPGSISPFLVDFVDPRMSSKATEGSGPLNEARFDFGVDLSKMLSADGDFRQLLTLTPKNQENRSLDIQVAPIYRIRGENKILERVQITLAHALGRISQELPPRKRLAEREWTKYYSARSIIIASVEIGSFVEFSVFSFADGGKNTAKISCACE